MANETAQSFDVIIVGGGPAGVSAAMGFIEARLSCLLIERGAALGGQLPDIPSEIVNWPATTFKNGAEAAEALSAALDHAIKISQDAPDRPADAHRVPLLTVKKHCLVEQIETGGSGDSVRVRAMGDRGEEIFSARYLLVATGYRVKTLPPPDERYSAHWHNHVDSLPSDLKNLSLAVIGGGDSALLKAIGLAQKAKMVHLVHRGEKFRCRPDLLDLVKTIANCRIHSGSEVVDLVGDAGALKKIVLRGKDGGRGELETNEVIVKVGYEPNTEILKGKVYMTETGHVLVSATMATSEPRIYAVGDITNESHPRIAGAIGQGMLAAGHIITGIFAERG